MSLSIASFPGFLSEERRCIQHIYYAFKIFLIIGDWLKFPASAEQTY